HDARPIFDQRVVELVGRSRRELRDDLFYLLALDLDGFGQLQLELLFPVLQSGFVDVAGADLLDGLRRRHLGIASGTVCEGADTEVQHQSHEYPQQWVLQQALAVHSIRPWWPRPSLARRQVVISAVAVLTKAWALRGLPSHQRTVRLLRSAGRSCCCQRPESPRCSLTSRYADGQDVTSATSSPRRERNVLVSAGATATHSRPSGPVRDTLR